MGSRVSRKQKNVLIGLAFVTVYCVCLYTVGKNNVLLHLLHYNEVEKSAQSFNTRCNCLVPVSTMTDQHDFPYNKTTCSTRAYNRGPGQRIVGYSYYGDSRSAHHQEKKYFEGIQQNLELLPQYYPGWIIRLYHDIPEDDPVHEKLCDLACSFDNFDLCDIQRLPGIPMKNTSKIFPMNWRFFPTLDPQVDIYVSRDLDSLFNEREQAAVDEWLESDKSFHSMRDHPLHDVGMLGSAWGVKLHNDKVRFKWRRAWQNAKSNQLMWMARNVTGPDQDFLSKYVWKWAKHDAMQHDSYLCRKYPGAKGFPTQRKNETNNFVAAVVAQQQYIYKPCPEKCRPLNHKDWEYC